MPKGVLPLSLTATGGSLTMVSAEVRCTVCPSGLVTVSVRAPAAAPTVFTVSVTEVGEL